MLLVHIHLHYSVFADSDYQSKMVLKDKMVELNGVGSMLHSHIHPNEREPCKALRTLFI